MNKGDLYRGKIASMKPASIAEFERMRPPERVQIQFRTSSGMREKIKKAAKDHNLSVNEWLNQIVYKNLEN